MNSAEPAIIHDNVVSLFEYLRELNKLRKKVIKNINDYPWYIMLSSLPEDLDNIHVNYVEGFESPNSDVDGAEVLFSIKRPVLKKCPLPDEIIIDWLDDGWDDYNKEATYKVVIKNEDEEDEAFSYNPLRVKAFNDWLEIRDEWAVTERIKNRTNRIFSDLYRLFYELERESETEEIVVANGVFVDKEDSSLLHPVLTQRVKLHFDPEKNIIYILNTDADPELYPDIFQEISDINKDAIGSVNDMQKDRGCSPLDKIETPDLFEYLINSISSDGEFRNEPVSKDLNNRFTIFFDPCFIVRKRLDGTVKAINLILESLKDEGDIPAPIIDIVNGGTIDIPEDLGEKSVEERLAAVGGESVDILLSKEANREQLEIARRIERYNAVLVQGPPGTGKTHTIANLMGHFLSQGKSVLVTSHTKKALQVLKEKVPKGLQDLCVSMTDDSNLDMERSIAGITSHMAQTTSFEIEKEITTIENNRNKIISDLAAVRSKMFAAKNREVKCIVYNGEEISPSNAAKYVKEHENDLSFIPGSVELFAPLPLGKVGLRELYGTNETLSLEDEEEIEFGLPDINSFITPYEFGKLIETFNECNEKIQSIKTNNHWEIADSSDDQTIIIKDSHGEISISYPDIEDVKELKDYHLSSGSEAWIIKAAIDGNKDTSRQNWLRLVEQIRKTCDLHAEEVAEQFGIKIELKDADYIKKAEDVIKKLRTQFVEKGKVGSWAMFRNKEFATVLDSIRLNGEKISSAKDCDIIIHQLELLKERNLCAAFWNELMAKNGVTRFELLDEEAPEEIARNSIDVILRYIDWFGTDYKGLADRMVKVGIPFDWAFKRNALDSDIAKIEKIFAASETTIPQLCDVLIQIERKHDIHAKWTQLEEMCNSKAEYCNSRVWQAIYDSIKKRDQELYQNSYSLLESLTIKCEAKEKRVQLLSEMEKTAPEWADAIKNRIGVHGNTSVPDNIEDAWKWKQYSRILDDIIRQPYQELQAESIRLSKEYRGITSQYAEKRGWYHLLNRTESDISLKQDLQGWMLTVKKIGKGTGKRAPEYRAKARALMSRCQAAVPCWIMPINKALETLDPRTNKFDIIIIDEASQADVSSLAILYMGKKFIIVGDDKQVSPMAVGTAIDGISTLEQMYIKDKIPNSHLYTPKTSVYDIASTTFQPLMLREHFRCVPEIIGFSNMLSYDYKIKPLRDAGSSTLLPAVVNYRVKDGKRLADKKANPREAETIVALMKACMEQPEYDGKTFGVISLLGDEQVGLIQEQIEKNIDPKDIMSRRLLCGNSANFQGDERDVVFLSIVDSSKEEGPLSMMNYGSEDAYRKRYNVAASRAKDQLWVVDSLDAANDLKPGDIRKTLIEYSMNPQAQELKMAATEEQADSPFEVSVVTALKDRGYHIVQQWKVGAYRIDMVAICGKKSVAIECDGERWHSGEEKIREDMERQTILERLGWRFIRIRGSEFYRNPEGTINRVVEELQSYGIEPEDNESNEVVDRDTELLNRVKQRALELLGEERNSIESVYEETIEAALGVRDIFDEEEIKSDQNTSGVKETKINTETRRRPEQPKERLMNQVDDGKKSRVQPDEKKTVEKKTVEKKTPTISKKDHKKESYTQLTFADMEQSEDGKKSIVETYKDSSKKDFISEIKESGVEYLDLRDKKGPFWILGGQEMQGFIEHCKNNGYEFVFAPRGSKATDRKPGWWLKKGGK